MGGNEAHQSRTSPTRQLEFWFEFGSTYSYPAALRVEALALANGVSLTWKAFLLGPIFKAQGWNDSPFNLYPAKGRYMWRDLERVCAAEGVEWRRPSRFPRNGLVAARIAALHAGASWLPAFVRAVYRANFARDEDISDPAVLARCLEAAERSDAQALIAESSTEPAKARLRAQTDEATAKGVFGAPSFVVGRELFWGNDRLESAIALARRAPASPEG